MEKQELLEIGIKKRKGEIDLSWDDLNAECGDFFKNGEAFRNFTRKTLSKNTEKDNDYESKIDDKEVKYKETIEINADGSQSSDKLIKMSQEQSKDVNFLLKSHGYSIKSWDLMSARNNIWNSYSKKDGVMTLYSSKIAVRPKAEFMWTEEDAKKVFVSLKTCYKDKVDVIPQQYEKNKDILVIPMADFHLGLRSDKLSTGNDYNLDIAEKLYYYTLNDIIKRVENKKFEKVLFIIGNDFVNADNLNGTTAKGTQQDNDGGWFSIVKKATQLCINGIDMLTKIAPVDVIYVPSNHDLHTMFGIMQTLNAWYRNDGNVKTDDSPMSRKYYKFGETLIALSHDIKVKEVLKIITSEAKDNWSNAKHIICLLAHLHTEMAYERQGYLEILRLPTISGWSRWTNSMGYIQSEKKNQSFIINKELGITDVIYTIIN